MFCQKCGGELHAGATYCGCGWTKKSVPTAQSMTEHVNCAHDGCFVSAKVKIKTRTGWANLCLKHYEEHFTEQAIDNLSNYGMERQPDESNEEWVLRMRQFVKAGVKRLAA